MISLLKKLDEEVQRYGPQDTVRRLAKKLGTRINIFLPEKTKKVLQKNPVVLVANHPYEVETLALIASLPNRTDSFMVVNAKILGLIPNLDKYIIPVYISHHRNEGKRPKLSGRILNKLHKSEELSPEEEHRRNIESIALAAQKIKDGGLVSIFPEKRRQIKTWQTGIGYLIYQAKDKKSASIIMSYIEGTSELDWFRLIPFINKILPPLNIYFSEAIPINSYFKYTPKEITNKLEEKYNQWMTTLTKTSVDKLNSSSSPFSV